MSSMDTSMEDGDCFLSSSRDGTVYGRSDYSGWGGDRLISGPNTTTSSSTSTDNRLQQQVSTGAAAAGGCTDDLTIVSSASSASSRWFRKNNKQSEVRTFNVDFRALSQVALRGTSNKDEEEKGSEINKQNPQVLPRSEIHGDLLKIGCTVNNETSAWIVNRLMVCANAVQYSNLNLVAALVEELRSILAVEQSGAKKKVATYFTDALDQRNREMGSDGLIFSNLNKAIHKAFADSSRVHIIDFNLNRSFQWRGLMDMLHFRPGGPPAFRLTAIGSLQPGTQSDLEESAAEYEVEFEFHGIVANCLADVVASISDIKLSSLEAVAVNFILEPYHLMLSSQGAREVEKLLKSIKEMKPKIVTSFTYTEGEPSPFDHAFVERFKKAWHYFCIMFELLERKEFTQPNSIYSDLVEEYLRMQIHNIVTGDALGFPCCEWEKGMSWG